MKTREADFSITFRHWLRANPMKTTCWFEMKQTTIDSIPFSCIEDHQAIYGEAIQESPKGVLVRVLGTNGEPDYVYTYRDPVYVVIKYPDCFSIISIMTFLTEMRASKRKSLTSARAREIAYETVDLKRKDGR